MNTSCKRKLFEDNTEGLNIHECYVFQHVQKQFYYNFIHSTHCYVGFRPTFLTFDYFIGLDWIGFLVF